MTVHVKRVIFTHLTEIDILISFESLDIAMSNSASGGFIPVSLMCYSFISGYLFTYNSSCSLLFIELLYFNS